MWWHYEAKSHASTVILIEFLCRLLIMLRVSLVR